MPESFNHLGHYFRFIIINRTIYNFWRIIIVPNQNKKKYLAKTENGLYFHLLWCILSFKPDKTPIFSKFYFIYMKVKEYEEYYYQFYMVLYEIPDTTVSGNSDYFICLFFCYFIQNFLFWGLLIGNVDLSSSYYILFSWGREICSSAVIIPLIIFYLLLFLLDELDFRLLLFSNFLDWFLTLRKYSYLVMVYLFLKNIF